MLYTRYAPYKTCTHAVTGSSLSCSLLRDSVIRNGSTLLQKVESSIVSKGGKPRLSALPENSGRPTHRRASLPCARAARACRSPRPRGSRATPAPLWKPRGTPRATIWATAASCGPPAGSSSRGSTLNRTSWVIRALRCASSRSSSAPAAALPWGQPSARQRLRGLSGLYA